MQHVPFGSHSPSAGWARTREAPTKPNPKWIFGGETKKAGLFRVHTALFFRRSYSFAERERDALLLGPRFRVGDFNPDAEMDEYVHTYSNKKHAAVVVRGSWLVGVGWAVVADAALK